MAVLIGLRKHWPITASTIKSTHKAALRIAKDTGSKPKHVKSILNHPLAGYLMGRYAQMRQGYLWGYGYGGYPGGGEINDHDGDADDTPAAPPTGGGT